MFNFLRRLVSEIISCDFFDCSDWPTTGHEHLPYERWLCAHWTTSLSGAHHVTMILPWARSLSQQVDIEHRHPVITLLLQYQTSVSISDKWCSEKERESEWAGRERVSGERERVCAWEWGERERKGRERVHICSVRLYKTVKILI